jgi:A/G-specific adenine glycosylase
MTRFTTRLLNWYHKNGRTLPWRGQADPYAIWVSEIMLQQTRVETVIPYFIRWMERFPTVTDLARASEKDVLNVWEGLGYYSRARNLRRAGQLVLEQHDGRLPRDPGALRKLPGIGRYTVGAISSMAFGLDEPTLDGNLRRVFARVFNVSQPADSQAGERILWDLAAENLPAGRAGDYNQALMDLGAAICVPRNPHCALCPLRRLCKAYELGIQTKRPVLKPKRRIPHYDQVAAVILQKGRVLLARRPSKGLLGGMWEFPNGRVLGEPAERLSKAMKTGYGIRVKRNELLGVLQHTYSHFRVTVHAFYCVLNSAPAEKMDWAKLGELDEFPMGKVDRQIARWLT